jgi:hypothetical protein
LVSVECPFDGCDYTGSVGSVEGHISGSQSGDHQGEVGRHFRGDLVEEAEAAINGGTTEGADLSESPDGSGDGYRSGEDEDASSGGGSLPPGKAVVVSTLILLVSAFGSSAEDDDDRSGGLLDG